jgi:large subunit ribosomal protein L25
MAEIVLAAEPRKITGKQVKALRSNGKVPVVLYGHAREALSLQVAERDLRKTLKQAGGHRLITLQVDGQQFMSLARDVQQHPLTRSILHADFQEVIMSERIMLNVPLHFTGDSIAVRTGLGVLIRLHESIQIEALPGDIIDFINVDLSVLTQAGQAIHVSDLKVPEKVRIVTDLGETVALIVAAKEEKIAEPAAEEQPAEVEVIKKERVPGEGEAVAAEPKK